MCEISIDAIIKNMVKLKIIRNEIPICTNIHTLVGIFRKIQTL